jgi:CubicO group peptidase (beta-lactamase class C family)
MKPSKNVRGSCWLQLTAITVFAGQVSAATAPQGAPPQPQWIGHWTGVADDSQGRFHGRSLVEFEITAGAAGLEFLDRDRQRGPGAPVKMTVQGQQFSTQYSALWPVPIHVSGTLSPDGKTLEVSISGDGMTGAVSHHAILTRDDRTARAFLAPRLDAAGSRGTSYRYHAPTAAGGDLAVGTAKSVGIDPTRLEAMVGSILAETGRREDVQTEGVLIQRHGKLVFEEYFWGQSADNPHIISSVTKSVTSILTGIAFDRGAIQLDTPVTAYLSDPQSTLWGQQGYSITLRNILSMSSGTAWDDSIPGADNPSAQLLTSTDIAHFAMSHPQIHTPGTFYNYDNSLPCLTGILDARKLGEPLDRFAEETLFAPLGIGNYRWTTTPADGVMSAGGFSLLPRDMVKIGQLMLQEGRWKGRRVVSAAWVRESTRQQTAADQYPYGFYWHLTNSKERHVQTDDGFMGLGQGGQVIAVFPALDMVVVVTSQNWHSGRKSMPFPLFDQYILPAVSDRAHAKS